MNKVLISFPIISFKKRFAKELLGPAVFAIIFILYFTNSYGHFDWIHVSVLIFILTILSLRLYRWCKYYIYRIELLNNTVILKFQQLNIQKKMVLKYSELDLLLSRAFVIGNVSKLVFRKNEKYFIIQYGIGKWNNNLIKSVFAELNSIQKNNRHSTGSLIF